jgi:hypothetical protein
MDNSASLQATIGSVAIHEISYGSLRLLNVTSRRRELEGKENLNYNLSLTPSNIFANLFGWKSMIS